jgi:membrane protease YdiL (CAAX protease family)
MAIPSVFFISNTAGLILGGQITLTQAVPALMIYFIHNVARSGLPEEFFYRVFVQTRFSQVLKSRLGGILVTSLLFGLTHIPNVMRWYPEMTLSEAFCSAFFIQGFIGLVYGVLWERTHNLIPGTIVHSGINALNNVGSAVALIFH